MVENYINELSNGKNIGLIIQEKGASRPVGLVSLLDIDWVNRKAMLEIVVDKSKWRKGLATEAIRLVLDYAFKALGLNKVWLGLYEDNDTALKLYIKVGFLVEATLKQDLYREGKFMKRILMGVVRSEWNG